MLAIAGRIPWRFIAAVTGVLVCFEAIWLVTTVFPASTTWTVGMDFRFYADLGARWLADGSFYQPRQLIGPYVVTTLGNGPIVDTLYPPSALLLFVPFAVLPAALWWALPIAVTAYALHRLRPAPWGLALMVVLLAWPRAIGAYLFGNTDIWVVAGVAAGAVWGWPALAVTIKPTLALLALIGIRRRSWWVALLLGLVFITLTVPMWAQYAIAMQNAQELDFGYSLGSLPLVTVPVVAWLASKDVRSQ